MNLQRFGVRYKYLIQENNCYTIVPPHDRRVVS